MMWSDFRVLGSSVCLGIILGLFVIADEVQAAGDVNRFKNGMVHSLPDIDQMSFRFCNGDLYGLEDESGREILPAKFSDIEYCGHGIFLATEVQKWNKYYFGDKRHFFNRDGVEVSYSLPDRAFLYNIFSFGEKADRNSELVLERFAPDTLLLFDYRDEPERRHSGDTEQGLCDLNGKVVMPLVRGIILFLEPGSAFVIRDGNTAILNLSTWNEVSTSLERSPGSVPRTRIPRPSNYQVPMPFPKDRKQKVVSTDDGVFDHNYWCEKRDHPVYGIDMFNRFLHEYDLIGMQKDKVAVLLGESRSGPKWAVSSETFVYGFPHYGCVPHFSGIKIYMQNERVIRWSFLEGDPLGDESKESESITTNVVLSRPKSEGRLGRPKYFEDGPFPAVEPKHSAAKPAQNTSQTEQARCTSISGEESTLEKFLPAPKKQTPESEIVSTEEADEQLRLAWDLWFLNIRTAIHNKVEVGCTKAAICKSSELRAVATFRVVKDGQVLNPEIFDHSTNRAFDSIVLDAINSMSGSESLKFPDASKREFIDMTITEVYRSNRPFHGSGTDRPYVNVWDEWKSRISKPIEATFLTLSERARLTSPKLKAVVRFKVTNGRQLTDLAMVEPSSDKTFNLLVIESIRRTNGNKVFKFPDETNLPFFEVVFTFDNRRYGPSPGYRAVPREQYSEYPECEDPLIKRK